MLIAMSGSTGLIGTALRAALTDRGDEVRELVRDEPNADNQTRWDPARGELPGDALDGVSAVVNLAGAGIGAKRWTQEYKKELLDSRVDTTGTLARALADRGDPVHLVNASAMGYYGDRGEQILDEEASAGEGFLPDLVTQWEAAADPAVEAGCPVAFARTGLVLSPDGGLMDRVLPLARLGLAGPLGSGREWWSWITLVDEVRAILHLIDQPTITGPVNLSVPVASAVRQKDAMRVLGKQLHRPAFLPAPRIALRVVLGEFADDVVASTRMAPTVLQSTGFDWTHDDIAAGMAYAAGTD